MKAPTPEPQRGKNGATAEGDVAADEHVRELWQKMWHLSERTHGLEQNQALISQRMDSLDRNVEAARTEHREGLARLQTSIDALSDRVGPLDKKKERHNGALALGKWLLVTAIMASSAAAGWYVAVDEPAQHEEHTDDER